LNGSNDKLNSNRIRPDNSNNNTKVDVQSNRDKDQSRHNNAVVHEKRIIYFSKPLVNYDDDEEKEENSNKTKKNLGNRQSQNSQQVQQQSSFDQEKIRARNKLLRQFFPDILKAIGNKAIKDSPPTLQELESYLQNYFNELQKRRIVDENSKVQDLLSRSINNTPSSQQYDNKARDRTYYSKGQDEVAGSVTTVNQKNYKLNFNFNEHTLLDNNLPIVTELIKKGYLVDSDKWLNKKGFLKIGQQILTEIIKSLKTDKIGMHETKFAGYGSMVQETSKKYEYGNEISNININSTISNFVERYYENHRQSNDDLHNRIEFPLDISYEDIEIYDTLEEIQVATVYCIDLSSTMKYSSMYSDLSRIEASKRALWSLFILNKKFFPIDSIHTIGFGSIASRVNPMDIPFLRTFEPNADFLHYTNYQAAYRFAKRILKKDGAKNKRIVMITDGHPSACFIDSKNEKDKIIKQRPYSHFYIPDKQRIGSQNSENNRIKFDIHDKQTVYLCYRYRQIDQYIGEQTIKEAKKLKKDGIELDTIMVSEEDTLLDFVNELAKSVDGKSIYINPKEIDRVLINDYLLNKKKMIRK
jgi:Mg-chelatase subunit ChlD